LAENTLKSGDLNVAERQRVDLRIDAFLCTIFQLRVAMFPHVYLRLRASPKGRQTV
jgi:hypothetical protein